MTTLPSAVERVERVERVMVFFRLENGKCHRIRCQGIGNGVGVLLHIAISLPDVCCPGLEIQ